MISSALQSANPKLLLIISRALAALRPSLIAFMVANATRLSGGMETPISFCNVLFVGNLCAAIAVLFWFGVKEIWQDIKNLQPKLMLGLFINGCLAALLSSLIFIGLEFTTVTNAVLLGRFGPVIYAIVGALLFKKTIRKQEWFGFSLIAVGITAVVLKSSNFQINKGDIFILASTFIYAATSVIGKVMLSQEGSVRIVVFSRNFVSAIIFFIIAYSLFGPNHFGDVFSGQLWIIMAVYAVIIIVLAQFLWYAALDKLDSKTIGKWTVLSPVFGIIYALLLNGEQPSATQFTAFAVIMAGVLITSLGKKAPQEVQEMATEGESSVSA